MRCGQRARSRPSSRPQTNGSACRSRISSPHVKRSWLSRRDHGRASAIGELQRALVELQESTWWRVGAPVRGAVTRLRATAGAGGRRLTQESPSVNAAPARKDKLRDHDPPSVESERVEEGVEAVLEALDSPPSPLASWRSSQNVCRCCVRSLSIPDHGRGCLRLIVDGRGCESQLGSADSAFVRAVPLAHRLELSLRVSQATSPAPGKRSEAVSNGTNSSGTKTSIARFVAGRWKGSRVSTAGRVPHDVLAHDVGEPFDRPYPKSRIISSRTTERVAARWGRQVKCAARC